jgi:hypothetical protein
VTVPMKSIETQVEIRADAETVWSILTDFSAYSTWNPLVTAIAGEPRQGSRLRVQVRSRDGREAAFRPRVVCCQPSRELRWIGRVFIPGILDGTHQFRIVPTGCGVLLYHCEHFTGFGAMMLSVESLDGIREGFESMNEALRIRAETFYGDVRRSVA